MNYYQKQYRPISESTFRGVGRVGTFNTFVQHKSHDLFWVIASVVLAITLSTVYLLHLGNVSTRSYKILELEYERSNLISYNQKVKVELLTSSSLKSISESPILATMKKVSSWEKVNVNYQLALNNQN